MGKFARFLLAATLVALAATVAGAPAVAADPNAPDGVGLSKIEGVAESNGAHGIYVSSGNVVVVVPADNAGRFPGALGASAQGVPILVQATDVSLDEVSSMREDLRSLRPSLPGNYSYGFYFDLPTATMIVQTNAPASYFTELANKYAGKMTVQSGGVGGLTYNRQGDAPAFWGGAAITGIGDSGGQELCSTGYIAKNSSRTYMVTAGHCFALGATIHASQYANTGYVEGTVTNRNFPMYEEELISGGSYSPNIYNGVKGDETSHAPIYGEKWGSVGQSGFCRTGRTSGRYCNWTVGSTNAEYCPGFPLPGYWCSSDLYAFSGTPPQGGDSGGPVYYPYNGGVLIAGTISGYMSTIFGTTSYAEKMPTVLQYWGLTQVCVGACTTQF